MCSNGPYFVVGPFCLIPVPDDFVNRNPNTYHVTSSTTLLEQRNLSGKTIDIDSMLDGVIIIDAMTN